MLLAKCCFSICLLSFVLAGQRCSARDQPRLNAQIVTKKDMNSSVNLLLNSSPMKDNPMLKSKITRVGPKLIWQSSNPTAPTIVNPPRKARALLDRLKPPTHESPNWGKTSQDLIELKANANGADANATGTVYAPTRPPRRGNHVPSAPQPYTLTPRSGLICWQPDYDTKLVPIQLDRRSRRETLINLISQRVPASLLPGVLTSVPPGSDVEGRPQHNHTHLQSSSQSVSSEIATPSPIELAAEPKLLPMLKQDVAANWDDWYRKVTSVLYNEWKRKEVSAGSTIASITVFDDRKVSPQVLTFTELPEVRTSPRDQQQFRETVLDLIKNLNKHQFWQFPDSRKAKVTIQVQFRKEVDGPIGCDIIR